MPVAKRSGERSVIASCPGCRTRYRLSPEKIGPQGARIRCKKCGEVFKVNPPGEEAVPKPVEFVARALVVERDWATAKAVRSTLERWAIGADVIEDGGEALLSLHRKRPDLVILGAGLSGIAAPAIAEILRRNPDLQEIPMVRVAVASELSEAPEFDADHTLEPGDLPDGLGAILKDLGVGKSPSGGAPAPTTPEPATPAAAPAKPAAAPARPKAEEASADPDVRAAERLARIVVSDIVLYNEDKFAKGAADGNVVELLAAQLEEAGAMFHERVSEELRSKRDFLVEELERRATKHMESQ